MILLYIQIEGEKRGQKERYWWFWNLLSETIQNIAINLARNKHQTKQLENKRNLIRRMLFADMSHQYADNEYDNIKTGNIEDIYDPISQESLPIGPVVRTSSSADEKEGIENIRTTSSLIRNFIFLPQIYGDFISWMTKVKAF